MSPGGRDGRALEGLETLVDGLFDYAGLFPPAALPFDAMLEEARSLHRTLHRPHIVGSELVVTPDHLPLLDAAALAGFPRPPRVCLVGLTAAQALQHAEDAPPGEAGLASLECTLPLEGLAELEAGLEATRDALARRGARLYIEPRWPARDWGGPEEALWDLLEALQRPDRHVGLKVRCAGPTALDRPLVARVVERCAADGWPLKATQGLHHPVLEQRYANEHGFLNVATALRLRQHLDLDVAAVLATRDAAAFRVEDGLSWQDHHIGAKELQEAVRTVPFAVGSCSLREPDEDLARLFPEAVTPGRTD